MLISQHLERQYTIATPLLKDNTTSYLMIENRSEEHMRFLHMSRHLLQSLGIENYKYFQGKKSHYIQLFIFVQKMELERADELVQQISENLATKLNKEWRCFPDKTLPFEYNIFTLPYGEIDL